jgi:indole-3-glycerol phosphate synthase
MNILDTIIARKRVEVAERKKQVPVKVLEQMPLFNKKTLSLRSQLLEENATGIIAEFKRRSPSKGVINDSATVQEVTHAYASNGACGISILTDTDFFGGRLEDLAAAIDLDVPLLRKDFMVDAYQLTEAKAHGASVILLIAACLKVKEVKELSEAAHDLGLEVLLELHGDEEIGHITDSVDLVGINNRNLKDFKVDLEASMRLLEKIPQDKLPIAESGINSVETIVSLKNSGFKGFLIGEHFMRQADPAIAFAEFIKQLKHKK